MNGEDFLASILEQLKALISPLIIVVKGIFSIMAQIFVFLADLISNMGDGTTPPPPPTP